MKLKIIKLTDTILQRGTSGSEGVDVALPDKVFIHPHSVAKFKLGIKLEIPKDYYVEVHPRSSMFHRRRLIAQVGIIDNDFKEELSYAFYNTTDALIVLSKGTRVCQLLIKRGNTLPIDADVIIKQEVRNGGIGSTGD